MSIATPLRKPDFHALYPTKAAFDDAHRIFRQRRTSSRRRAPRSSTWSKFQSVGLLPRSHRILHSCPGGGVADRFR